MASWFDDVGSRIGDALIAPQTFGGLMPMPTDPAQRQQMIGPALLTLGAGLFQGARQGQGPLEAFSSAYGGLQQQGAQQGQQRLQGMLLGSKLQEQQKKNQTREALKKMTPPEGYTPQTWGAFVDAADTGDLLKIWQDSIQRQRDRSAIGSMGGFPGAPSAPSGGSGGAPSPGGVFDVPQQFAPQVQAAAQKYGVPVELLASTFYNESRWNPNARNDNDQGPGIPSLGLGQWGAQWAQARGFDPLDPNASIEHTAQAMAEYAKKYGGNFMLARLAYGWGPGNVDKWLQAGGDPNKVPDGAKVWLPRTAFGIEDEREARAAFPRVAQMLRPGPVQMPWQTAQVPTMQTAGVTAPNQPEAVTPVQYTPGRDGQPAPQIDYQSDPVIQEAFQAFNVARQRGDLKGAQEARQRAAARVAELQKQAAKTPSTETVTTNEGVFLIDKATGQVIRKLGDRPSREEGTPREFTMAGELRKEFGNRPVVKDYLQVAPHVQAIRSAVPRNTRAADINIVFAFAKMLDPTSVVREGEQITIGKTGGVWETIKGWAEKLNGGGMLTPEIRKAIQQEAEARFETYRSQYAAARDEFEGYFRSSGLDPSKSFNVPRALDPYTPGDVTQDTANPTASQVKKGQRAVNPQTGQEILWDGKQWLDVKTLKPVTSGKPEPMPTR